MHLLLRVLIVPACAAIGAAVGMGVFEPDSSPSLSGDVYMIRGMVQIFAECVGLLIGFIVGLVWAINAPRSKTWRPLSDRDDLVGTLIVFVGLAGGLIMAAK